MKSLCRAAILAGLTSLTLTAQQTVAGDWMITVHEIFGPNIMRMSVVVTGDEITGTIGRQKFKGTVKGDTIELTVGNAKSKGTLVDDGLQGEVTHPDRTVKWTAVRVPPKPATGRTHDFEPTEFHRYFASSIKPALRINAGDTVRTWSVDAGGRDKDGKPRVGGGNPQTGPFYVEGAVPNDTLVVRLTKVRTNRNWAGSGNSIMRNALDPWSIADMKWASDFPTRWTLDAKANVAFLEKPTDALKGLVLPMQPMLGCVAVAPPGESSIRTTDSGRYGGNMDYNELREGTTIYLPVYHPGALLFVGDGHARQGDGELTGDALETSMDIEFTVDVIPGTNPGHPLAENAEFLISIGIGGTLDQALQMATTGMVRWLDRDYGLTANEAAMVLGFAVKYDVVDLVGTQVSVAAKVPKAVLAKLPKKPAA
jgi:acetamidase/formamidase